MKYYARFQPDGRVLDVSTLPDEDPAPGAAYEEVANDVTPFSHVKRGGQLVALTPDEEARLRAYKHNAVWDSNALDWVDARSAADYGRDKAKAVRAEALTRIQAEMPGINDFEALQLVRELWLSIAPAARQPTAKLAKVLAIHQAARQAITAIQSATDRPAVDAVVVTWP
ncbi:MAG: hypothetical protein ACK54C_02100 [Betaproteobacteria bacterium]